MFRQKTTHTPHSAAAQLRGSAGYPELYATVTFTQRRDGVLVTARAAGLPPNRVLGFHIHEGAGCTGSADEPFADTRGHYNPSGAEHPYHAGDLPPLFTNGGQAYMSVLTNRFTVRDIAGKTVVIHSERDDFTTQPSGAAGEKIACGVIHLDKR